MKKLIISLCLFSLVCFNFQSSLAQPALNLPDNFYLQLGEDVPELDNQIEKYFWIEFIRMAVFSEKIALTENWEGLCEVLEIARFWNKIPDLFTDTPEIKSPPANAVVIFTVDDLGKNISISVRITQTTPVRVLVAGAMVFPKSADPAVDLTRKKIKTLVYDLLKPLDPKLAIYQKVMFQDRAFAPDDSGFKVLLLPFWIDGKGPPPGEIGRKIRRGLLKFADEAKMGLKVFYEDKYDLDINFTERDALFLLNYHGADFLLWGEYDVDHDQDSISFNYLLAKKQDRYGIPKRMYNEFVPAHLSDFQRGHFTGDLHFIIHLIKGLSKVFNYNYKDAQNDLEALLKDPKAIMDQASRETILLHLASISLKMGRADLAESYLEQLDRQRPLTNRTILDSISVLQLRITAKIVNNEMQLALPYCRVLLNMLETGNVQDGHLWIRSLATAQLVFSKSGQSEKAIEFGKRALHLQDQFDVPDQMVMQAIILNNIGSDFNKLAVPDSAEYYLVEALEKLRLASATDRGTLATVYNNLSTASHLRNDLQKAEAYQKQAVQIGTEFFPPTHPTLGIFLHRFATIKAGLGQAHDAIRYAKMAKNTLPKPNMHYPYWYLANIQVMMIMNFNLKNLDGIEQMYFENHGLINDHFEGQHAEKMEFYTICTQLFIKMGKLKVARSSLSLAQDYLSLTDPKHSNYSNYSKALQEFKKQLYP